jgi:hypothetical protein
LIVLPTKIELIRRIACLAENQRGEVAAVRCMSLLPGIGAKKALSLTRQFLVAGSYEQGITTWKKWKPPKSTGTTWNKFLALFVSLVTGKIVALKADW